MISIAVIALIPFGVVTAHDIPTTKITWSAEVAPVVYRRCVSCHRTEGLAPMPLTTYEQVRPWAKAVRDHVLSRQMPPWGAIRGYRALRDDLSLTQEEILRIAEWVEGGAPEGDRQDRPPVPSFSRPGSSNVKKVKTLTFDESIRTHRILRAVSVLGLKPLASCEFAKVVATFPDGRVEPLLWLYRYRNEWNRRFLFRIPLEMPAGAIVTSEPPVPLQLLLK